MKTHNNIKAKYSIEIDEINDELEQLQKRLITDLSKVRMDGLLDTHATRILKNFNDLIDKINNDLPSKNDRMAAEAKQVLGKETN